MKDFMEFVCEHLPEDWEIRLLMEYGGLSFELINPEGEVVDRFADDNEDVLENVRDRVNFARDADGLCRIEWDGTQEVVL